MYSYSSGGATGKISLLDTYTIPGPIKVDSTQVYFNLTGQTGTFTNGRFQFQAWNTSSTGYVPVKLGTGATYPSYVLNARNFSYVNPTIVMYTQLSNVSVTVSFATVGLGFQIFNSTMPITGVSWDSINYIMTIQASGLSSDVIKFSGGPGGSPQAVSNNGLASLSWAYDSVTNVVTLTGTGPWAVTYICPTCGASNPSSVTVSATTGVSPIASPFSTTLIPYQQVFDVQVGDLFDRHLSLTVHSPASYWLTKVSFSVPWITSSMALPATFQPTQGTVTIPIRINTTGMNVSHNTNFQVHAQFSWIYGVNKLTTDELFNVNILQGNASFLNLPYQTLAVISAVVGVVFLVGAITVAMIARKGKRSGHYLAP